MSCRSVEAQVAVMLCGPGLRRLLADITAQRGGLGMGVPQKRTSRLGLIDAAKLDGVMGRGRAEPFPPFRLTVVAVSAGIGEDIDAVVPYLQGESIGMGVGGD